MNPALASNAGHFFHGVMGSLAGAAFDSGSYVAATAVSSTGVTINLLALPRRFRSCKVILPVRLDLTTANTVTVGGSIVHCTSSGGSFTALATFSTRAFAGATTATSQVSNNTYQSSVDLRGAKQFIRVKFTHAGNTTATGSTVTLGAAVIVFAGADETPASAS
jgi:hypothetical protein